MVREISRSSGHNIEPYNDAQVRASVQSLNRLYAEAAAFSKLQEDAAWGSPLGTASQSDFKLLLMQHELMRTKRCLLVYHKLRLDHLARLTIELPSFPANVRAHLSKAENRFQLEYSDSLSKLSMAYENIVSIGGPLNPPKELFITVRVVKDCGTVQTEYGPLFLNANSFHYVRKSDVEHLITQGFLLHAK